MLLSIWEDIGFIKNEDFTDMPGEYVKEISLSGLFPDWFRTIVMISIAMVSNAIVSLAKSKFSGTFVFSVWLINIALSVVVSFFVDNIALWIEPEMNVRAEGALMVITGILTKDILELAEKKGLSWIRWKSRDDGAER